MISLKLEINSFTILILSWILLKYSFLFSISAFKLPYLPIKSSFINFNTTLESVPAEINWFNFIKDSSVSLDLSFKTISWFEISNNIEDKFANF